MRNRLATVAAVALAIVLGTAAEVQAVEDYYVHSLRPPGQGPGSGGYAVPVKVEDGWYAGRTVNPPSYHACLWGSWGDAPDVMRCNVKESGPEDTTPVGRYSLVGDSPCGAQDMAGNVLEWTSTQYRPYPYDAGDGREATPGDRPRVLRGGAFNRCIDEASCMCRHQLDPAIGLSNTGCRVCLRLVPLTAEGEPEHPASGSVPD